ncbi:MAG: MBL fold metallo-hydrolase [Proteobacteria bacterium]|nr:MBL fold metallo-hydrolase [Pseudomonadota bacterium]
MNEKKFASTGDMREKRISFTEIGAPGSGCYSFTAEGDPNSGVIIGDNCVLVIDAQATPILAQKVIAHIREVTDKPIHHLALTHYHAVRVLGACAYHAQNIIMSDLSREYVVERGQQDWDSEFARFPRLFSGHEDIPGLTWPTVTFSNSMTLYLGGRVVELHKIGRGHTAGDMIVYVPDSQVMFAGDLVEYKSACYCGDAHFTDWFNTLDRLSTFDMQALLPGRGDALTTPKMVAEGIKLTKEFLSVLYGSVADSAQGGKTLKEAFDACNATMRPAFGDFAIFEHCQPFNVSRAYDEARGIDHPTIWTAERDSELWAALNG